MRTLISAVGDTDPIRDFHDGSLLHIARVYRPDKIIVIHSERTQEKHDKLEKALFSISDDYKPEIVKHEPVLLNSEVPNFDVMFDRLQEIVLGYFNEKDDFILNLSSATPQIKAAFFVINRLSKIDVKAVQVLAPSGNSNEGIGHDNTEDIDTLIDMNIDAGSGFKDRTKEDTSENFRLALLKKTARDFIEQYDYQAALDIVEKLSDSSDLKAVKEELRDVVESLKKQDIPKRLGKKLDDTKRKILNAFLTIDLQKQRGNVSEGMIRVKTLTEFILEDYITNQDPGAIVSYVDKNDKEYLGLWDYRKILKNKGFGSLYKQIKPICDFNRSRNQVAHSLAPLTSEDLDKLSSAVKALKKTVREKYGFSKTDFEFYQMLNQRLLEKLQ